MSDRRGSVVMSQYDGDSSGNRVSTFEEYQAQVEHLIASLRDDTSAKTTALEREVQRLAAENASLKRALRDREMEWSRKLHDCETALKRLEVCAVAAAIARHPGGVS